MLKVILIIYFSATCAVACIENNQLQVNYSLDRVEAILGEKLEINNQPQIVFKKDYTLWFSKKILWRIEYKNKVIDCDYLNNIYFIGDIKIVTDGINTTVTDMHLWDQLIIKNYENIPKIKKSSRKRRRIN